MSTRIDRYTDNALIEVTRHVPSHTYRGAGGKYRASHAGVPANQPAQLTDSPTVVLTPWSKHAAIALWELAPPRSTRFGMTGTDGHHDIIARTATDGINQFAATRHGYLLYNRNDMYIGRAIECPSRSLSMAIDTVIHFWVSPPFHASARPTKKLTVTEIPPARNMPKKPANDRMRCLGARCPRQKVTQPQAA